jgi:hypothetical protein
MLNNTPKILKHRKHRYVGVDKMPNRGEYLYKLNNAYLITEMLILLQNWVKVILKGLKLWFSLLAESLGTNTILD